MVGASGGRKIVVEFLGKDVSAGSTAAAVETKFGKLGGRMDRVGQVAGKALAGGALLGAAALVKMGRGAAEDETAAVKLATALKNTAGATKGQVAATEKWITAQGKAYGVTDDELRPALAKLTAATHDIGKSQKLASLAMDISAGSGQSLETVTKALAKAQNGSVAGLTKLGIKTSDSTKDTIALEAAQTNVKKAQLAYNEAVAKYGPSSAQASIANDKLRQAQEKVGEAQAKVKKTTIDMDEAVKRLSKTYGGQAAKAAETTAGKQKRLQTELSEMGETIGYKVLPAMLKLADIGLKVADWASKHAKLVLILGGALVGVMATMYAVSLAMRIAAAGTALWSGITKIAAAAQWLLNAAMDANPIGLVVLAIAALVAGFILAYKHSETFRAIVQGAFDAVKSAAEAVGNWFKGPFAGAFVLAFNNLKTALAAVGNFFVTIWNGIKNGASSTVGWISARFNDVVGFVTGLPGRISKATVGMWDGIKSAFKSAINWIIGKWNDLEFKIPSVDTHIPGVGKVGGFALGTPNIPLLAKGGNVRMGGAAIVGEAGPELLTLPRGAQVSPLSGGGAGGTVANLTINLRAPDGRVMQTELLKLKRTNGGLKLGLA